MELSEFAHRVLGIRLNEFQMHILDNTYPKHLHRMPRIIGKSTAMEVYAMYIADKYDGCRIAYATHNWSSSLKKRMSFKDKILRSDFADEVIVIDSATIQLKNGSTIDVLNHSDVVKPTCSYDLVLLDEPQAFTAPKFFEILEWVVFPDGYILGAGTWQPGEFKVPKEYKLTE